MYILVLRNYEKYNMLIPLQPLITLPLYDRPDTYIMLNILEQMNTMWKPPTIYIRNISIQEKEWNVKPPPENKNKFRRTREI